MKSLLAVFVLGFSLHVAAADIHASLTRALNDIRVEHQVPAMSIVVVDDGEVVYAKGFGFTDEKSTLPANEHTRFRVASISKLFTAQAVMQLVQAGKVELNAPVATYLPDAFAGSGITIRQLLTHTSGLEDRVWPLPYTAGPNQQAYFAKVIEQNPLPLTGGKFEYSDTGFNILGAVVESISGMRFHTYVEKFILRPAQMAHSGYYSGEAGVQPDALPYHGGSPIPADKQRPFDPSFFPCEGLIASAQDLATWASRTMAMDEAILSKAAYQQMLVPQVKTTWGDIHMGLGWQIDKSEWGPVARHAGEVRGYSSLLMTYPAQELAVAILANGNSAPRFDIAELVTRFLMASGADGD